MIEIIELSDSFVHSLVVQLTICVVLWVLIICAVFIDLWDRIYTQQKTGRRVVSNRLRLTLGKFSEYWRFLLIAFIIDAVIFMICTLLECRTVPVVSILFSIGLLIIEVKSLIEHAKERKSNVVEMQELVKIIIDASSKHDARQAIKDINDYLSSDRKELDKGSKCT